MKFHFWVPILFFLSLNWDLFTAEDKEGEDVTLKASAEESTEGDVPLKAAPEDSGDVTLKAAPEETTEGDVNLKAAPEGTTEGGDAILKAAPENEEGDVPLKAAAPVTTTIRTTTTVSTNKPTTLSSIKAAKLNWLNMTNQRNIKMRQKYNNTLEKYKDKYKKKEKPNKMSPNMNVTEPDKLVQMKNKTKEYYQAKTLKTFGKQITFFTACMGVDWVKKCYVHIAMCAIFPIPLLCLWTLACGGMNTRKCHKQAYPQFTPNVTTPLSVSPSLILTTLPPIPDALQEARRRKRYADWL